MALRGQDVHYRLDEINVRHWKRLAASCGPDVFGRMIAMVERVDAALQVVQRRLPEGFPHNVWSRIAEGMRRLHGAVLEIGSVTLMPLDHQSEGSDCPTPCPQDEKIKCSSPTSFELDPPAVRIRFAFGSDTSRFWVGYESLLSRMRVAFRSESVGKDGLRIAE